MKAVIKFFAILFGIVPIVGLSQDSDPVHWNFFVKQISKTQYEIHCKATIDKGWHICAQVQPKEAIALPTKISFDKNPMLVLTGKPKESGKKQLYENKEIEVKQYQYEHEVDFVQTVTLKAVVKTNISGSVKYQVCTEEKCLPAGSVSFNLPLQ